MSIVQRDFKDINEKFAEKVSDIVETDEIENAKEFTIKNFEEPIKIVNLSNDIHEIE